MLSIIDIFKKYDLQKGPETFKVYLAFAAILEAEMRKSPMPHCFQ